MGTAKGNDGWWRKTAVVGWLVCGLWMGGASATTPASDQAPASASELDRIVQQKLTFYNRTFPQIQFIRLRGGTARDADMKRLTRLLGSEAKSLDFQHPADLRAKLLQVSLQRVSYMLQERSASASLFQTGSDGSAKRPNVCVLTLDGHAIAANDEQATRHLLDLADHTFNRIHESNYLDSDRHLAFVVDHEVYHCLDSFVNGPVPMSRRTYAGPYAHFRSENGADAFGIAMHIRAHGNRTAYARNLLRIRGLALLSDDPNHFTHEAIRRVMHRDAKGIAAMSPAQLVDLATRVRNRVAADYDQYVAFRVAALETTRALGVPRRLDDPAVRALSRAQPDEAVTDTLFYRTLSSYRQLFVAGDPSS